MINLVTHDVEATRAVAGGVASLSRRGDLIVLAGEMGAGKTAFAQGFAAALGVVEPVTSPTFTLVHTYETGSTTLHHADLYRLDRVGEVDDLAIDELLDDSIVLVEWGDIVGDHLGPRLEVFLFADDPQRPDDRALTVRTEGVGWASRWERLEAALETWAVR